MRMNTLSDAWQHRFGGIARLYGNTAMTHLAKSTIAVVGLGGVGSWSAEALARSGVGNIVLIDLDEICVTNTNRQVHTLSSTIGQSKAAALKERLLGINPECQVQIIEAFIDTDNARDLIDASWHGVIDAIDSAGAKAAMIYQCKRKKVPIIITGASGGKKDPSKVSVIDLSKTTNDPLLAKVRSILKRHYGFTKDPKKHLSLPAVYSVEKMQYPQPDGSVCTQKGQLQDGVKLDCAGGFGASTMVTATVGLQAAAKVIEKVLARA